MEPEDKDKAWKAEEPIEETNQEELTEEEQKKKEEDHQKKISDENEEVTTIARRPGTNMFVWGHNFLNNTDIKVRFIWENINIDIIPIFKNETKLGVMIPGKTH